MVYVDDMFFPNGTRILSNLFSDTSLKELNQFATTLGMTGGYCPDSRLPHYDVDQEERRRAIELGARTLHFGTEEWGKAVNKAKEFKRNGQTSS